MLEGRRAVRPLVRPLPRGWLILGLAVVSWGLVLLSWQVMLLIAGRILG